MAPIPKDVRKVITQYLERVRQDIHIKVAILYGSQVTGTKHSQSDVDLAVFAEEFGKHSYLKNQQILQKYLWGLHADLQPVGYSSEDYESDSPLDFVGGVIKKEGVIVCQDNKVLL